MPWGVDKTNENNAVMKITYVVEAETVTEEYTL